MPCLGVDGQQHLTKSVTKEEVSKALNSMKPCKAPGPDGFQVIFIKQYWHIIGDDIWKMVQEAFTTGYFDPAIAETLIVLILKLDHSTNFKEFRPISLCNTIYKIVTKVLVSRLRPLLNDIFGPFQSSFIPGRGTSGNAIILQEIIHGMYKSKKNKGDVVYKIDLEKAYDHVDCSFLKNCLLEFGFPPITVRIIMHCVCSSSLSVL